MLFTPKYDLYARTLESLVDHELNCGLHAADSGLALGYGTN